MESSTCVGPLQDDDNNEDLELIALARCIDLSLELRLQARTQRQRKRRGHGQGQGDPHQHVGEETAQEENERSTQVRGSSKKPKTTQTGTSSSECYIRSCKRSRTIVTFESLKAKSRRVEHSTCKKQKNSPTIPPPPQPEEECCAGTIGRDCDSTPKDLTMPSSQHEQQQLLGNRHNPGEQTSTQLMDCNITETLHQDCEDETESVESEAPSDSILWTTDRDKSVISDADDFQQLLRGLLCCGYMKFLDVQSCLSDWTLEAVVEGSRDVVIHLGLLACRVRTGQAYTALDADGVWHELTHDGDDARVVLDSRKLWKLIQNNLVLRLAVVAAGYPDRAVIHPDTNIHRLDSFLTGRNSLDALCYLEYCLLSPVKFQGWVTETIDTHPQAEDEFPAILVFPDTSQLNPLYFTEERFAKVHDWLLDRCILEGMAEKLGNRSLHQLQRLDQLLHCYVTIRVASSCNIASAIRELDPALDGAPTDWWSEWDDVRLIGAHTMFGSLEYRRNYSRMIADESLAWGCVPQSNVLSRIPVLRQLQGADLQISLERKGELAKQPDIMSCRRCFLLQSLTNGSARVDVRKNLISRIITGLGLLGRPRGRYDSFVATNPYKQPFALIWEKFQKYMNVGNIVELKKITRAVFVEAAKQVVKSDRSVSLHAKVWVMDRIRMFFMEYSDEKLCASLNRALRPGIDNSRSVALTLQPSMPQWWRAEHDMGLMVGVIKHGYGQWNAILRDENLLIAGQTVDETLDVRSEALEARIKAIAPGLHLSSEIFSPSQRNGEEFCGKNVQALLL